MEPLRPILEKLKTSAYITIKNEKKPSIFSSFIYFFKCMGYSVKLIFKEKELLVFSLLQLIFIGLSYFLFIQIIKWIPQEIIDKAAKSDDGSTLDTVLTIWAFLCVGLTSYPVGILTSCMVATHFLHETGQESTIAKCMKIVFPRAWAIWIFSWIDAWWTLLRILERLPKKKQNREPLYVRVRNELMYQAWKASSLGFLPALIIGRDIKNCTIDSLALLKTHFKPLCQLRIAYSLICWLLTIGSVISWIIIGRLYLRDYFQQDSYYDLFLFIGLIMMSCLFFIHIFFRPIYLLSACKMYSTYIKEKGIKINFPTVTKCSSTIVAFIIFMLFVFIIMLCRDKLGIIEILSTP